MLLKPEINPRAEYTQKKLQSAYKVYRNETFPKDESIMCSIHDSFPKSSENAHNCLGCNFSDYSELLSKYLNNSSVSTPFEAFSGVIWYSYLLIERFEKVFKIIKLHEEYRSRNFQIFGVIKRWTNFFKHPKAFILVHHPEYYFTDEIQSYEKEDKEKYIIIDQAFIDNYYSNDSENAKLYGLLTNKRNVVVIMPSLPELIAEFCKAQVRFIDVISNNEVFRELLDERTTLRNYFENTNLIAKN